MSCNSPLYAVDLGFKDNGSRNIKLLPRRLGWLNNYQELSERYGSSLLMLPCGKCLGCKLAKAREWAVRCTLEASLYDQNCFLTLTYDDKHLPSDGSVVRKHLQDFIKRLRKVHAVRYFGVCERGSMTARLHAHLILFGFDPSDIDMFKSSALIRKLWPYGNNYVDECNFATCQYVARYTTKKVFGKFKSDEFLMMSLKPGIGAGYIDQHREIFSRGVVHGSFGVASLPRYFEKLAVLQDIDLSSLKQEKLTIAMQLKINELIRHQMSHLDMLNFYKESLLLNNFENKKRKDL